MTAAGQLLPDCVSHNPGRHDRVETTNPKSFLHRSRDVGGPVSLCTALSGTGGAHGLSNHPESHSESCSSARPWTLPIASRLGLLAFPPDFPPAFPADGSGSPADFLSFDPPPCVQLGRRDDLRGDVGGRGVAGTSGVLMGANHRAVHADRPVRTFGHVGVRGATPRGPRPGFRRLTSGDAG